MTLHRVTLDSWAILAWLQGEPSGSIVRDLLMWRMGHAPASESLESIFQRAGGPPEVFLNIINLGEVFYILGRKLGERTAFETIRQVQAMPLEIVPVDDKTVFDAARIKIRNRVSYADAFAIVTAKKKGAILLTGDPEMRDVAEVKVHYMRGV